MKPNLTTSDIWHAWILPIVAALVVAAILVIERLQVDWSVSCAMLGQGACAASPFAEIFGWLPVPLTFGALHIWGARRLVDHPPTAIANVRRVLALAAFLAIHLLPVPGLLLFYAGVGAGIAISLTVVGLIVAPFVGVLAAGFVAGLALGVLAGPPLRAIPWRFWKTLLWNYGIGGALGAAVLSLGQMVFDPAFASTFGLNLPWLTALGTLAVVLVVGIVTSEFASRGWARGRLVPAIVQPVKVTYAIPAALAAMLVMPVHFMVTNELTIFRRDGTPVPALAELLRGYKPGISTELKLAGLTYVGPRGLLSKRSMVRRSRTETRRVSKGTTSWATETYEVDDNFAQWELADLSRVGAESLTITADQSALQVTYECEPGVVPGQEFCIQPEPIYREHLNKAFAIAYPEDAFLRSADAPDSALAIRFDARKQRGPDKREWPRLYCRLNLTAVTMVKLSVMQIVPCDADWVALALKLRDRLTRDFVVN